MQTLWLDFFTVKLTMRVGCAELVDILANPVEIIFKVSHLYFFYQLR